MKPAEKLAQYKQTVAALNERITVLETSHLAEKRQRDLWQAEALTNQRVTETVKALIADRVFFYYDGLGLGCVDCHQNPLHEPDCRIASLERWITNPTDPEER